MSFWRLHMKCWKFQYSESYSFKLLKEPFQGKFKIGKSLASNRNNPWTIHKWYCYWDFLHRYIFMAVFPTGAYWVQPNEYFKGPFITIVWLSSEVLCYISKLPAYKKGDNALVCLIILKPDNKICELLREKGPTAVKRRFKTQLTSFSL